MNPDQAPGLPGQPFGFFPKGLVVQVESSSQIVSFLETT
jgi:hypothetical protein